MTPEQWRKICIEVGTWPDAKMIIGTELIRLVDSARADNARLRAALEAARMKHADRTCDKTYPELAEKYPCDCGAEQHNAAIDAAMKGD